MNYFITTPIQNKNSVINKASSDISKIAIKNGYSEIRIDSEDKKESKKDSELKISTLLNGVEEDDIVFHQFSSDFNTSEFNNNFIDAANKIGSKSVVLVHDLVELVHGYDDIWQETADYLNKFYIVIVHTQKMADIIAPVVSKEVVILDLFDYLRPTEFFNRPQFEKIITSVENISKNQELSNWENKEVELQIFSDDENLENKNIVLKKSSDPDYLPSLIKSGFGLVWFNDEENLKKGGKTYLRPKHEYYSSISAPHSLSLLLSAGVPVFVKSNSAQAEFISENNLGFVVDSLEEAISIVEKTTEEEYKELIENVAHVQGILTNGFFTQRAFLSAIEKLNIKGDF